MIKLRAHRHGLPTIGASDRQPRLDKLKKVIEKCRAFMTAQNGFTVQSASGFDPSFRVHFGITV